MTFGSALKVDGDIFFPFNLSFLLRFHLWIIVPQLFLLLLSCQFFCVSGGSLDMPWLNRLFHVAEHLKWKQWWNKPHQWPNCTDTTSYETWDSCSVWAVLLILITKLSSKTAVCVSEVCHRFPHNLPLLSVPTHIFISKPPSQRRTGRWRFRGLEVRSLCPRDSLCSQECDSSVSLTRLTHRPFPSFLLLDGFDWCWLVLLPAGAFLSLFVLLSSSLCLSWFLLTF